MTNRSVGKAYVINRKQAHEVATVVIGTLTFNSVPLLVLFDSGATHSFISSNAVTQIGHQLHKNPTNLLVSLPTGQAVECHVMFENCPLSINQEVFEADLIQLNLLEFDIVLGMDWLSKHGAAIDYQKQKVTLKSKEGKKVTIWGSSSDKKCPIISALSTKKLLRQGCIAFLCFVTEVKNKDVKLEDISVVKEYPDVFPEEIPGLPPKREIDFEIEVEPSA